MFRQATPFPILFVFLLLFLSLALAFPISISAKNQLIQVAPNLKYQDDGDRKTLIQACQRQLDRLVKLDQNQHVSFAQNSFTIKWLTNSMRHFLHLLHTTTDDEFYRRVQTDFVVYQALGRSGRPIDPILFTGYYEPIFQGSLTRKAPYLFPVFRVPDDLIVRQTPNKKVSNVGRQVGSTTIQPYWDRQQITEENHCQAAAIAYLTNPIDVFVLHVQGSGKLQFPDGSLHSLHFAGSNGHPYKSIGKLLVDEGAMTLEETNMESIRHYLTTHPSEQKRVLNYNPRFIFFKWAGGDKKPKGSGGVELTPGRSIAIDNNTLPWQSLGYITTSRPNFNDEGVRIGERPLTRFVVAQDTGSAIKGSGRVDIFWGNGKEPEKTASYMKETGNLFFLIKKGYRQ